MSDNQPIDIGLLVKEISKISDDAETMVQKIDAAVNPEELPRDLIIQTYKETSKSHILIIKRLQDAYGKFSKREVERIRDKTSRQKQAERRDDGTADPVAMELQTLQTEKSDLFSNVEVLKTEVKDLKGEKAGLSTKNEVLEGENARLKEENAQLEKDKTQLSTGNEALKGEKARLEEDKTRLEGEVARWEGQSEEEKELHNEVETNKELQKNIHKTNEAHAEILPSEPTTTPIGGSSDQNRAPGTPEENATLDQSQVQWADVLAFARVIVSNALAFAVVAQNHGNMRTTYPGEFAMNCTDFLFFIHSLRPDKSLHALKVEWPPEWLDADNITKINTWTKFCSHVQSEGDDPCHFDDTNHPHHHNHPENPAKLLKGQGPVSTLKSSIKTRLDKISSWKGTRLETFPSTLLTEDLNIFGIAKDPQADKDR
ncbi:hypothetical protein HBI56_221530 [Parastagonospora nodorum]|nr:hypothetical protein HBI09_215310 [Parastagonospora nodorum]KAH4216940.1 hypothetical protein HBI06_222690 [Parastagonospora nodorum]KAH4226178.1 hypothetical protein HBI05_224360 [Parastagonospora nodorum]KAH4335496.1 hypothetical protein HBH98_234480 [Parastagonospora nodorum]KAH4358217.1 hypothetical protein HBH97_219320 [Parastagonospora nodorum]